MYHYYKEGSELYFFMQSILGKKKDNISILPQDIFICKSSNLLATRLKIGTHTKCSMFLKKNTLFFTFIYDVVIQNIDNRRYNKTMLVFSHVKFNKW